MKIPFKICRVETPLGASMAAELGARYVGLHAINQERLTPAREQAFKGILRTLAFEHPQCRAVLVTRTADPEFLYHLAATFRPSLLQLHFEALDPEPYKALRDRIRAEGNPGFDFIKCIALDDRSFERCVRELEAWEAGAYGLLIDRSFHGGTGDGVDPEGVRELFARSNHELKLIAGGLTASNVVDRVTDSGADGADVQSSVELPNPGKAFPYQKDFTALSAFALACENGTGIPATATKRFSHPQLLVSPVELAWGQATELLQNLRCTPIQGIQIDGSDGRGAVTPWAISPADWAELIEGLLPEAPIWLHLFTSDPGYVLQTCRTVAERNPFLRGVFIQPEMSPLAGVSVCGTVEASLGIPAYLSVTVGTYLSHPEMERIPPDFHQWQLTFPAASPKGPLHQHSILRTSLAIERLHARGGTVHLDRGITPEILKSLSALPDGVTMGRGMLDQSVCDILDLLRRDSRGL